LFSGVELASDIGIIRHVGTPKFREEFKMLIIERKFFLSFISAIVTFVTGTAISPMAYAESLEDREKALIAREKALEERENAFRNDVSGGTSSSPFAEMSDVLPNAKPGQCFSKVLVPAEYKTTTEKVVIREAAHKIEIIPQNYVSGTQRVTIKPATEKIVEVPAVYEKVKEEVLIKPAEKVWKKNKNIKSKSAPAEWVAAALSSGVPKDAALESCYEQFIQAEKFETVEEKILKRQAGKRIEIIPAKYEWVEEKVLTKEASENLIDVAPVFETKEEKVLEKAAYTTWKKGRGPIERINNSTGEIMCLVEVPAQYKTIVKKVLKTKATIKKVSIPAEYKTIKVRKLVSPAKEKVVDIPATYQTVKKNVRKSNNIVGWRPENTVGAGTPTGKKICHVEIPAIKKTLIKEVIKTPTTTKKIPVPAEFKDVKVRKLATPAKQNKIDIPAKYETVKKRVKVAEEKLAWRSVLCKTNTTKELIIEIQKALKKEGFNPGTFDGSLGGKTQVAINDYQKKKGFERGGITLRTLDALGVKVGKKSQ